MIYLHTGLPGAGKTLYTLHAVRQRAEKENRTVYYAGIEILKPDEFPGWQPLTDPAKWHELPDGAIIVHDEAQTLYRPRGTGAQVPDYVAKLETHRHQGYDIYYVTQHPMLIDSNVRRLAGEHRHVVRAFGAKYATVHCWPQVKEQCDKSRGDSLREQFMYPKALFEAYRSATVHTHKARIPARVWMLAAVPVALGLMAWGFSHWFSGRLEAGEQIATATASGQQAGPGLGAGAPRRKTKEEWLEDRTPRIAGLSQTAPVYDKVTEPVRAPYPAACLRTTRELCRCWSDQATELYVPKDLCNQIVDKGYYVDWDTAPKRAPEGRPDRRASDGRDAPPAESPAAVASGAVPASAIADAGRWGGVPRGSWGGVPVR